MTDVAPFTAETIRWIHATPELGKFPSLDALMARIATPARPGCSSCGQGSKRGEISAAQMDVLFGDPRFAQDLPGIKRILQVTRVRVLVRGRQEER